MRRLRLSLLLALLCLVGSPALSLAQSEQTTSEASSSRIAGWSTQLDSIAELIGNERRAS